MVEYQRKKGFNVVGMGVRMMLALHSVLRDMESVRSHLEGWGRDQVECH